MSETNCFWAVLPLRRFQEHVMMIVPAVLIALAIAFVSQAGFAQTFRASDVEFTHSDAQTRFSVVFSSKPEISIKTLAEPYRVIVDLPPVLFDFDGPLDNAVGLIEDFRFGAFSEGRDRIVLDISAPVSTRGLWIEEPDGKSVRLVLTFAEISTEEFDSLLRAQARTERVRKRPTVGKKGDRLDLDKQGSVVIVLDPGHGGIDNGAKAVNGLFEKDLTLEFARDLRAQLRDVQGLSVVLTRDKDQFLSLRERVRIAQEYGASLMVSIHADSVKEDYVRGASVYRLSEKASDRVAAQMAARENRSDILAGLEIETETEDAVADILLDLTRRETTNQSILFQRTLIGQMRGAMRLHKNPNRSAGFQVLRAFDVPSVLLELGYLSNSEDGDNLISKEWRQKASLAIANAIRDHVKQVGLATSVR